MILKRSTITFAAKPYDEPLSMITEIAAQTCCHEAMLSKPEDFGRAHSFDFILASCKNCGVQWLNVFCTVNGVAGYRSIIHEDAQQMSRTTSAREKTLLIKWIDENL